MKSRGLKCPSATAIAPVGEAELIGVLEEMNVRKPVIAINTATLWHALRTYGINDQVRGFGRLMQDF